jgi:N-acetylmuramoyl-L-alanine amidase
MIRPIAAAVLAGALALWAGAAAAQFSALARPDPARSGLAERADGLDLMLTLSQPVPYRVYTLAEPPRLVMEFRTVDFGAMQRLGSAAPVTGQRFGAVAGGYSRMVMDLAGPYGIDRAGMLTGAPDGSARIEVRLVRRSPAAFAAGSGRPLPSAAFPDPAPPPPEGPAVPDGDDRFVVALDPGHGGVDPGAVRDGVHEADLMLTFARALRDTLRRRGVEVAMTRDADVFVSLDARLAAAKRAGADVFVSLHADAIAEGIARGAQVYTLSERASSAASARLAERHNRQDLLAGLDLTGQDDRVAQVLMALARTDTQPRSAALAGALVEAMRAGGLQLHRRARESAAFAVLRAPDVPSVLVEVGFMSSPGELAKLQSAEWRARAAEALAEGILAWAEEDAARADLRRR